jgi:hypothetical protein
MSLYTAASDLDYHDAHGNHSEQAIANALQRTDATDDAIELIGTAVDELYAVIDSEASMPSAAADAQAGVEILNRAMHALTASAPAVRS